MDETLCKNCKEPIAPQFLPGCGYCPDCCDVLHSPQYCVISGNPFHSIDELGGLIVWGPFHTKLEAAAWAAENGVTDFTGVPHWLVSMEAPEGRDEQ